MQLDSLKVLQDENASMNSLSCSQSSQLKLVTNLPSPVVGLLQQQQQQQQPPHTNKVYKNHEYVAVAPHGEDQEQPCGCVAVRKLKNTRMARHISGNYKCPSCDVVNKQQQKALLKEVKQVVMEADADIWVFVEFPLQMPDAMQAAQVHRSTPNLVKCKPRRADVMLVADNATSLEQVLVIELDGSSHDAHPPAQGRTWLEAREEAEKGERVKNTICRQLGLKLFRLKRKDMHDSAAATRARLHSAVQQIL
jgi:hypothetical protein